MDIGLALCAHHWHKRAVTVTAAAARSCRCLGFRCFAAAVLQVHACSRYVHVRTCMLKNRRGERRYCVRCLARRLKNNGTFHMHNVCICHSMYLHVCTTSIYIYICIYVYMYMYECLHIYVYIYMCVIYTYIYICVCMQRLSRMITLSKDRFVSLGGLQQANQSSLCPPRAHVYPIALLFNLSLLQYCRPS